MWTELADGSVPAFMQPSFLCSQPIRQLQYGNKTTKPLEMPLKRFLRSSLPSVPYLLELFLFCLVLWEIEKSQIWSTIQKITNNFVLWEVTFCCKGVNKVSFCFVWFDVWGGLRGQGFHGKNVKLNGLAHRQRLCYYGKYTLCLLQSHLIHFLKWCLEDAER